MFNPIKITYTWDKETFLKASHAAYQYEMKDAKKRYLGWFFIALTQFGVVAAMKKGAVGLLLISTILVIYWYFLRWPMRKLVIQKSFDKSPNANHQYHIYIQADGINVDDSLISWSEIIQIVSLTEGFLLYQNRDFFFLPSYAFESLEEKNRFSQYAKAQIKHYIKG